MSDVSATFVLSTIAAPGVRLEDAVLLGRREPGVQRQHLDAGPVEAAQRIGGVVDLALAAQEHEHVAGALAPQLVDGVDDRLHLVALVLGLVTDGR